MDSGRSREMILVVEDNPDVKTVATTLLEQLNYSTIAVESAKAALDFLAAGKPVDLVFSDVMLPGGTQRPARDADLTKALSDFRRRRSSAFNAQRRTGAIVARHIVGFRRWRAEW
ncbi:MAG: response regulator [Pseudolabrys sp.]